MENKYTPVIGLEIHIELSTATKMFCGCSAVHFAVKPNTNTCPVCLGLPGALPFANKEAIDRTIKFGLAFDCKINKFSKFDRKHYFYPDLPKAYQISQYDLPFCRAGKFKINGRTINIIRIHLEEDTGKLIHQNLNGKNVSLIDFNRSGVPLMEMVTEPDFDNLDDVLSFLKEVQLVSKYLGISGADMEKGSMRLEANISMTDKPNEIPNYKIELKNINSFKFLKKALVFEIKRQTNLLKSGITPDQETRGYSELTGETFTQRSKEEAKDYRYFPEPDLPPIELTEDQIDNLLTTLSELPAAKRNKYITEYKLKDSYVEFLTTDPEISDFFDAAVASGKINNISPDLIAGLMVNQKMHKNNSPEQLIKKAVGLQNIIFAGYTETEAAVKKIISENPEAVKSYKEGKEQILGFLIGQVQRELKGTAEPKLVKELLEKSLQM